jgi:hypothetical protein
MFTKFFNGKHKLLKIEKHDLITDKWYRVCLTMKRFDVNVWIKKEDGVDS